MDAAHISARNALLRALEEYDSTTRDTRAERIEWVSLHRRMPSIIMGRAETLHLLEEARQVFISGHFIATLLTAMAVIEHCLVEELTLLGRIKEGQYIQLGKAIEIASKHQVFPSDWLTRANTLSFRRNPFAHLKETEHRHSLGVRIRDERRHPSVMVEEDAKDAISLMYDFFAATLREADPEALLVPSPDR